MSALPSLPSFPPHLWPTNSNSNSNLNKPTLSFSRAARDLTTTLDEALAYFRPFYTDFRDETKDIRAYADTAVIDRIWVRKIFASASAAGAGEGNGIGTTTGEGEGEGGERDMDTQTQTSGYFRDHQAAVYSRCEDVLCAVLPPVLLRARSERNHSTRLSERTHSDTSSHGPCDGTRSGSPYNLYRNNSLYGSSTDITTSDVKFDAAALMTKMARCREDLFPALRRMGNRFAVVGTAIKEMEVLRAQLETFREVWDMDGNRDRE
jgi:hypothetical protein